jgi:transposase-like protein
LERNGAFRYAWRPDEQVKRGLIGTIALQGDVHLTGYFSNHYAEMKRLVSRLRKARKAAGGRRGALGITDSRGPVATNSQNCPTKMTASDTERMLGEYRAGASVKALADRYGVSPAAVGKKVRKAGLPGRRVRRPEDEIAEAAALYAAGATLGELEARLRICSKTLRRRLVEVGVVIRPRGRRPRP